MLTVFQNNSRHGGQTIISPNEFTEFWQEHAQWPAEGKRKGFIASEERRRTIRSQSGRFVKKERYFLKKHRLIVMILRRIQHR